jgi:hypothetical protein
VLETRGELRLVLEHLPELLVLDQVREDPLDDDLSGEPGGPDDLGVVDLRHAATGDELAETVLAQEVAGHGRHSTA